MSFFRPEAHAALWRWREVLAASALAALGLYWVLGPGGLLFWVGWLTLALAAALGVVGGQRGRFRTGTGGPGVVLVDEGEITYMGPLTGGTVAAADMERLTLDPAARPPHWVLEQPGRAPLFIPVNAEGADELFDVFAALPGLRTEWMLSRLRAGGAHPVVIWERRRMRPATRRLH
ncbi:MAG: hypothetical protein ACK5MY_01790 [Jhaorihella sp.]